MRPPRPSVPHTASALARYLDRRIEELRGTKNMREIAAEAGYEKSNILSMFRSGETKIPLDRIPALARALECDPAHLLRLGLRDLWPEFGANIEDVFGRQLATANEHLVFLRKWRNATGDADPAPNARIAAAVDAMIVEVIRAI